MQTTACSSPCFFSRIQGLNYKNHITGKQKERKKNGGNKKGAVFTDMHYLIWSYDMLNINLPKRKGLNLMQDMPVGGTDRFTIEYRQYYIKAGHEGIHRTFSPRLERLTILFFYGNSPIISCRHVCCYLSDHLLSLLFLNRIAKYQQWNSSKGQNHHFFIFIIRNGIIYTFFFLFLT